MRIHSAKSYQGAVTVPGDKSVSHRALIIGAISDGITKVQNFLQSEDCLSTMKIFKALGIKIETKRNREVWIHGKGKNGLKPPSKVLDAGNSGTTIRLLMGLLSAQPFKSRITGDSSLKKRPMDRVIVPLEQMGALLKGRTKRHLAPIEIKPVPKLKGTTYVNHLGSAQVKSAILLAGLYAKSKTIVKEKHPSRDHTEKLFKYYKVKISSQKGMIKLTPPKRLIAKTIQVPSDISSAAFYFVAAAITPNSNIVLKNVGINPTRRGCVDILMKMGAKLSIKKSNCAFEPCAEIRIKSSKLKGVRIPKKILPTLIDELPILMVAAVFANGRTIIPHASELRVKETDRIKSMVYNLKAIGANISVDQHDTITIQGNPAKLRSSSRLKSFGDHRTAMSMIIAGGALGGTSEIDSIESISISYPNFMAHMKVLKRN